jgi:hypothetical protein
MLELHHPWPHLHLTTPGPSTSPPLVPQLSPPLVPRLSPPLVPRLLIQGDVDNDRLDREQIEISVMDADLLGEDLIGSYFIDASYLYYSNKRHQMYRQWLVLTAPYEARAGTWGEERPLGPHPRPPLLTAPYEASERPSDLISSHLI